MPRLALLDPTKSGMQAEELEDQLRHFESLAKPSRAVIKIDCAEFQHSREIAKLIGSPPRYLGIATSEPEARPTRTDEKSLSARSRFLDGYMRGVLSILLITQGLQPPIFRRTPRNTRSVVARSAKSAPY
jgi:hypothetical protein